MVFDKDRNVVLRSVTFLTVVFVSHRNSKHFISSLSDFDSVTWQRRPMTQENFWQLKANTDTNTKHHLPVVPHKECQVCPQFPNVGNVSTNICPADSDWGGGSRAGIFRESYQAPELEPVSLGSARPLQTPCWHCQPASRKQNTSWGQEKTRASHPGGDQGPPSSITSCVSITTRNAQSLNVAIRNWWQKS